jgi:ribosomal protein S18 acetylase RimI-like enzyme
MELRPLPATEPAVRRWAEELWLPYHRELAATVENYDLAEDVDPVAEEVPFRIDRLESDANRAWVAVEGAPPTDADLATVDAPLAGFVTTQVSEPPPVFERPDRLVVGDLYVVESCRGTGLADALLERAAERARETGCAELALDVDVANERARSFYRKHGFEPVRHRLTVDVDAVDL